MKSVSGWLSVLLLGMYWLFRIAVTISSQYGDGLGGFIVFDKTVEIALLFVSLVCFALILRRIIWGAVIYILMYGMYFGNYLVSTFIPAITNGNDMDMIVLQNSFIAIIGIALGIFALLTNLFEKTKTKHFSGDKTDWFMNNSKYDRNYDERADKNEYKTL